MASVAEPTDEARLSRDEMFDVLGNRRRRSIVEYLIREGDAVDLNELVDHVAARENGKARGELVAAERKRVYTSLQQTHLPKMQEMGLVDYDSETNVVQTADSFNDLNVYLQVVAGRLPFSLVYLILSMVSLGVVGGVWLGTPGLSSPLTVVVLLVTLLVFGATSIGHWYYTNRMILAPELLTEN